MTDAIGKIETALHLMNSMVLSGEAHSRQSVEAYVQGQEAATALRAELDEAKAEIERLRDGLWAVEALWVNYGEETGDEYDEAYGDGLAEACSVARQALKGSSQ